SMILYEIENESKGDPISSILFGVPKQAWVTKGYPLDSQTLYNRYYFNQIEETTDINLITVEADVFLNEYDINTLDFRNPIYLQSPYGSAYFKLLKVEYTDSNYPSTVLLQKVVLPDTNR
ncbi:MAG TPA: hypothetical protein VK031_05095, partial [Tissierellaceae bacterium]|nr:hypothetical protein [Tissierellaceae bacterium]